MNGKEGLRSRRRRRLEAETLEQEELEEARGTGARGSGGRMRFLLAAEQASEVGAGVRSGGMRHRGGVLGLGRRVLLLLRRHRRRRHAVLTSYWTF